uniref:Uncharacterized protein n=1 Tax=Romanomermis culicivorax TaxID=13658 RepID=A0A915I252_ROMCU
MQFLLGKVASRWKNALNSVAKNEMDPFSQQCCLKKSHNIRETQIIVQQAISGFIPLKVDQLSRIYSNAGFAGNELLPNVNDISFQNCLDLCYEQPM